jgi:hypothetical protein
MYPSGIFIKNFSERSPFKKAVSTSKDHAGVLISE